MLHLWVYTAAHKYCLVRVTSLLGAILRRQNEGKKDSFIFLQRKFTLTKNDVFVQKLNKKKFLQVALLRNKTNIFLLNNTVFGFLTYPPEQEWKHLRWFVWFWVKNKSRYCKVLIVHSFKQFNLRFIYIFIYTLCVCVCVCVRERMNVTQADRSVRTIKGVSLREEAGGWGRHYGTKSEKMCTWRKI